MNASSSSTSRTSAWISLQKIALVAVTWIVSINVWTGGPALGLWVGSRFQGDGSLTLGVVGVTVVAVAIVVFGLALLLSWLNDRYDELLGKPQKRHQYPWLKGIHKEREQVVREEGGVNAVERTVILSAVAAVVAFEIWFFFFASFSFIGG